MRNKNIDILRGIATLSMILIHTSYYFIGTEKSALFIWNWSQFAVPMFVFCAGYVFFLKDKIKNLSDYLTYMKHRLFRLLFPYWIFMVFFFPIIWYTSRSLSFNYVWQSIFIMGGIDINWLVLLMIELAILFPFVAYLQNKQPWLFKIYIVLNVLLGFIIFFWHWNVNYKFTMWYFWGLSGISSMLILPNITKKFRYIFFVLSLIVFIFLFVNGYIHHHDLSFINNKYPPDLYILSYGMVACLGLYQLAEWGVFNYFIQPLSFISKHSYSIYFIHYSFLIFLAYYLHELHLTWYLFFALIVTITLIVQWSYNKIAIKFTTNK